MGLKVNLLDIVKRLTPFDKKVGIIRNGDDNSYPERIERYINNSVTAKSAANIMATYLAGNGFGEVADDVIVNKKLKTTLQRFTQKVAKSIAKQRGVFIHINYNANFQFSSFDVIPYNHCRLGKKDDNKYAGKIGVHSNWSEGRIKTDEVSFVDVFNPNKEVISEQVKNKDGWEKYKGQILYVNLDDEYDYALSTIDAVTYDCDSESQSAIFKNKSLRKGFFGKTMVITKPLAGNLEDYGTDDEGRALYNQAQSERTAFKETIDGFIGAENTGGALHIEMENESDDINAAIKFENITSDINDKIFEYTENSTFKNILMAFNNIPTGLVRSDNSLFSASSDALQVMKETYQENTSMERKAVEQLIQLLMKGFTIPTEVQMIPLIIKQASDGTIDK